MRLFALLSTLMFAMASAWWTSALPPLNSSAEAYMAIGTQQDTTVLAPPASQTEADSGLAITYIANEGFFVEADGKGVLIDALFREGVRGYQRIDLDLILKLEKAESPFNRTHLILITHLHKDHFDARSVGLHLKNNVFAKAVAGTEITQLLRDQFSEAFMVEDRVLGVTPAWKEARDLMVSGIKVRAMRMRHGWPKNYPLHHLGFILELGGKKLLHVGDLEIIPENFEPFDLVDEKIDIAFLPYWMLINEEGAAIVNQLVKPKTIIAMHVMPNQLGQITRDVHRMFPAAIIASEPLQKFMF